MLLALVLVGCSHTTGGEATRAPESRSSATAPVNASSLDPGNYPVMPQPPLGNAGSDHAGRLVEGHRMAAYVVGPWEVEPSLIGLSSSGPAVIAESKGLTRAVWAPIGGGAYNLSLVVGFVTERQSPGPNPQLALRNSVLRFASPAEASQAAQNMTTAARHMPRDPTATPIVTEPESPCPFQDIPTPTARCLLFRRAPKPFGN